MCPLFKHILFSHIPFRQLSFRHIAFRQLASGAAVSGIVLALAIALVAPGTGLAHQGSIETPPFEPVNADFNRALTLIKQGDFSGAMPLLEKVVHEDDQNADAYHLLGDSLRRQERYDEALRNYQRALKLAPNHRGAHASIGATYLALSQPAQARQHLEALDSTCWFGCKEYDALKQAIAQYEAKGGA